MMCVRGRKKTHTHTHKHTKTSTHSGLWVCECERCCERELHLELSLSLTAHTLPAHHNVDGTLILFVTNTHGKYKYHMHNTYCFISLWTYCWHSLLPPSPSSLCVAYVYSAFVAIQALHTPHVNAVVKKKQQVLCCCCDDCVVVWIVVCVFFAFDSTHALPMIHVRCCSSYCQRCVRKFSLSCAGEWKCVRWLTCSSS